MSTNTISTTSKWTWTSILLAPALVTMILSIINYVETDKLDSTCSNKVDDAKKTSLGMMVVSLLLFVSIFFILKFNNLLPFFN